MAYKPVNYIVEYVVCALVFFMMTLIRYFSARRFPNQKNHLFSLILWITAVNLVTDVFSSLIIDNVFSVPLPIIYFVNTTFYASQIALQLLMMCYTMVLVGYVDSISLRKRLLPLLLPGLCLLALLLSNPITCWFFYVDPVAGYVRGPVFLWNYAACAFYMAVTLIIACKNRRVLQRNEFINTCRFLLIVMVSTAVQYVYPALLITGVAIAIAVILMYFTLQNPDSMLDAATGAFTYEAMLIFLRDRMQERDPVRLVAVKIHNMPRINEVLGVRSGSLLLMQLSAFMMGSIKGVWVFRMWGSCFVAAARSSEKYQLLCSHVSERMGKPWKVGSTEIMLKATICNVEDESLLLGLSTPEDMVNYLETIFAMALQPGENVANIRVGAELLNTLQRKKKVEAALCEAIATDKGLELYFQPLWNVALRRFDRAEALLRFQHPTLGCIPPDEFVPIAESSGLVTQMDELVVRKACAFLRDVRHLCYPGLMSLEVNLSALEFMYRKIPEMISEVTREYGVDPGLLCFEITETAATESFELLKNCMASIKSHGCRFALDDFGTGYANVTQVIQLPFSVVKLDRSLLYGPAAIPEDMVRMFNRIGSLTVIEGVETAEQAARAEATGVGYIQGYYYAKPMHQQAYMDFLKKIQEDTAALR